MTRTPRLERRAGVGRYILAISVLGGATGCMSEQLRFTTARTVNALPDLQYQQVVDNLARIASNPGFLPYLAVAGQGSVQVTDNGSSVLALNMPPQLLNSLMSVGASRNVTGTWSLGTITNPDKLRSMQAVYLRAICGRAAGDPAFGWFKIGGKGDVPRQPSYVGRFGDVFVWIMPDGIEGLSNMTLAIMDIATSDDAGAGSVVTDKSLRGMTGPTGILRRNFQIPPVGPVFTPGGH